MPRYNDSITTSIISRLTAVPYQHTTSTTQLLLREQCSNTPSSRVVNREGRMKMVEPEILVHRNTASRDRRIPIGSTAEKKRTRRQLIFFCLG